MGYDLESWSRPLGRVCISAKQRFVARGYIASFLLFAVCLCSLFCLPYDSAAADRSNYNVQLSSRGLVEFLQQPTFGKLRRKVSMKGHIPGVGRAVFEFRKASRFNGSAVFVDETGVETEDVEANRSLFLIGSFRTREQSGPVAVAVFGGKNSGFSLDFTPYLNRKNPPRLSNLKGTIHSDGSVQLRNSAIPSSAAHVGDCALHSDAEHKLMHRAGIAHSETELGSSASSSDLDNPTISVEEGLRVADMGIVADPAFYRRYGKNSGAELIATINAINSIYERDLGLTINLVKTVIFQKVGPQYPFEGNNASLLLDQLVEYVNKEQKKANADLFHLITGKDIYDTAGGGRKIFGVAGIAYVGTVCTQPRLARGVSENAERNLRRVILGHEIGHNFAATHGPGEGTTLFSATSGIMGPTVNATNDFFSSFSRSQVLSQMNFSSSCLTSLAGQDLNSLDAGSTLTLAKAGKSAKNARLQGFFLTIEGSPVVAAEVDLLRVNERKGTEQLLKRKFSGFNGKLNFRVKKSGTYQLRYRSNSAEVRSELVSVRIRK